MLLSPYTRRAGITATSATQVQFAAADPSVRRIKLSAPSGRIASVTALPSALTCSGGAGTLYIFAELAAPSGTAWSGFLSAITSLVSWNRANISTAMHLLLSDDGSDEYAAQNSVVTLVQQTTAAPSTTHRVPLGELVWTGTAITSITSYEGETGGSVSLGGKGYIQLPIPDTDFTDGTGSLNTPGIMNREVSTGTQTANTPKRTQSKLNFSDAADKTHQWTIVMPGDYGDGGTLYAVLKATSATTNVASLKAAIAPTVDSSTDDDAQVFNAVVSAAWTPPGTQGQTVTAAIALTMTNVTAFRKCTVMFGRDGPGTLLTDSLAGDIELCGLMLEYTKA